MLCPASGGCVEALTLYQACSVFGCAYLNPLQCSIHGDLKSELQASSISEKGQRLIFLYRYSYYFQQEMTLRFLLVSVYRTLRVGEKPVAQCNSHCNCFTSSISPVCGGNGVTYLSSCFAGCSRTGNSQISSSQVSTLKLISN